MKNLDWCIYTYRHRRAFVYVTEKLVRDPGLREEMLRRARVHDMDKMVLYLFFDQHESQLYHVKTQPHHLENELPRTREDLVETVLDYECAPYTKPDKPLNCFDFTNLLLEKGWLGPELHGQLLEIMRGFGIDRSYPALQREEDRAFVKTLDRVTEEDVQLEILTYMREDAFHILPLVREALAAGGHLPV